MATGQSPRVVGIEVTDSQRERAWIMAREINQSEYETEVVGSPVPVLLDVYGEHCGPCRQLAPMIDRLAGEYEGRARVLKVEAGANRELAGDLGVSSVPTVVVFKGGQEFGRLIGLRPESAYRTLLHEAGAS
jgi:thioredoxin 1